jgi:hypothetical protein
LETRKVLLHHKSGDITTHYSGVEFQGLINTVESLCEVENGIALTLLKWGLNNQGVTQKSRKDISGIKKQPSSYDN